jgi:hypothetical protein
MIEALKQIQQCLKDKMYAHAEMYLSEAIAQLESQEPVCEWCDGTGMVDSGGTQPWGEAINIPCRCQHTQPPQRTWIGLAKEDRLCAKYMQDAPDGIEAVIDYIETKLKEKNT